MDNCDSYINVPSSQNLDGNSLCWARNRDMMCFLLGMDKPIELNFK
jgi:hypothetical protein